MLLFCSCLFISLFGEKEEFNDWVDILDGATLLIQPDDDLFMNRRNVKYDHQEVGFPLSWNPHIKELSCFFFRKLTESPRCELSLALICCSRKNLSYHFLAFRGSGRHGKIFPILTLFFFCKVKSSAINKILKILVLIDLVPKNHSHAFNFTKSTKYIMLYFLYKVDISLTSKNVSHRPISVIYYTDDKTRPQNVIGAEIIIILYHLSFFLRFQISLLSSMIFLPMRSIAYLGYTDSAVVSMTTTCRFHDNHWAFLLSFTD